LGADSESEISAGRRDRVLVFGDGFELADGDGVAEF
jgi:hypothetical protein